jgi:hypothetical protein
MVGRRHFKVKFSRYISTLAAPARDHRAPLLQAPQVPGRHLAKQTCKRDHRPGGQRDEAEKQNNVTDNSDHGQLPTLASPNVILTYLGTYRQRGFRLKAQRKHEKNQK